MEYKGIYRWNFQQSLIKNSQRMNRPKNSLASQNSDNLNLSLLIFLFLLLLNCVFLILGWMVVVFLGCPETRAPGGRNPQDWSEDPKLFGPKKIMGIFHGIPIENGDRNSGFTH